jgi:hypothetical protein
VHDFKSFAESSAFATFMYLYYWENFIVSLMPSLHTLLIDSSGISNTTYCYDDAFGDQDTQDGSET